MSKVTGILGDYGTRLLRCLPAEWAHHAGMALMEQGLHRPLCQALPVSHLAGVSMRVPVLGDLPHPVGLAAGFDKDCRCPQAFADMGFGFMEIGTVTPRPQKGNPKPRMFRVPAAQALINRMGFNSAGSVAVASRMQQLEWNHELMPIGVNLGKNKITPNEHAIADFISVFEAFDKLGRYFVVNLSSPNTPGLRDLASPEFVQRLGLEFAGEVHRVWIKLDPDMEKAQLQQVVEAAGKAGYGGLLLTNTHKVDQPYAGGLSGAPLASLSASRLEWAYEVHQGSLPMIAVGGINSGLEIIERILRGASLVQIYTSLVYSGPGVVYRLLGELQHEMKARGIEVLRDVVGGYYNG